MNDLTLFSQLLSTADGRDRLADFAKFNSVHDGKLSYDDFVCKLQIKIQDIIEKHLESSRDKFSFYDEDSITHLISACLCEAGYKAAEQTKQNGAVDLTVQHGEYKWIAEAKIAYNSQKVFEGLLQLLTRYATRDKNAGMLIYVKKKGCMKIYKEWVAFIQKDGGWVDYSNKKEDFFSENISSIFSTSVIKLCDQSARTIESIHELLSGDTISVKHFFVDLYYCPMDKSASTNKSLRKDLALNELEDYYHNEIIGKDTYDKRLISIIERLLDPS